MDSTVIADILTAANQILPIREYIFLADKGYDVRDLYNTVRDVYDGEAVIPLSKRSTKKSKRLAAGNPICEAGLAMSKDGRRLMDMAGSARNSAALSSSPRQPSVPVTTKMEQREEKTGRHQIEGHSFWLQRSIDRECLRFKRTYALRTEYERYNSHFKETG